MRLKKEGPHLSDLIAAAIPIRMRRCTTKLPQWPVLDAPARLFKAILETECDNGAEVPSVSMQPDSLTSRVTSYIFDYIRTGGLTSGDNLPSELRTSTDLGISRGIVREAFSSLEVAGIIEKGNGRSPKVGVLNSDFLTHLFQHALSTRQISSEQVLDLRASVESRAAELAATRRSQADIQRLRAATNGMKKSISMPDEFVIHDLNFHDVINGASGNPLVEVMGGAMHECMQQSMRAGVLHRHSKGEMQKVVASHALIVDAIERRDSSQAGKLMKRHFMEAKKALQKP